MPFDVAIGLRRDVLERAFEKLYTQLYTKYFKGSVPADGGRTIVYDVKLAPKLDFSPTLATAALLREEIARFPQPERSTESPSLLQAQAPSIEALAASIESKTLKLVFNSIDITIKSTRPDAKSNAKVVVWLTYEIEYPAGQPPRGSFKAKRIEVTASNPDDQFILDKFLGPVMLKLAAQLLSAVQIPGMVDVAGYKFDLPEPRIAGDYFIVLGKLLSHHYPLDFETSLPGGNPEAFVLVSDDLLRTVFIAATKNLDDQERANGPFDAGVGQGYYDVAVVIKDINGRAAGAEFPIGASVSGSAHLWVNTVAGTIEAFFTAKPVPPANGRVALSGEGNRIRARIADVAPFSIDLQPSGFIAYLLYPFIPLIEAAALRLVPLLVSYLKTISFDVWTVPDLSVSYDGVGLTLRFKDLKLSTSGTYLLATGSVQL